MTSPSEKLSTWHICGDRIRAVGLEKGSAEYLNLFKEETQCFNDLVLFFIPSNYKSHLPHLVQTWLRNYVAGLSVYFLSAGIISFFLYGFPKNSVIPEDPAEISAGKLKNSSQRTSQNSGNSGNSEKTVKPESNLNLNSFPSNDAIWKQIKVSMAGMPLYVSLPTFSEFMIESGWTKCYSQKEEMGTFSFCGFFFAYMLFVEFGVYWMHRLLHDIKPLYKMLHSVHHIYNKQNTLSPFAGLAFHPLDGILQASPHMFALFLFPTHFFTHEIVLFLEGIWTALIHDTIDDRIFPIMGAGYHTVHHTTYRHNYGHYTILMDWVFGTLRDPEGRKESEGRKKEE